MYPASDYSFPLAALARAADATFRTAPDRPGFALLDAGLDFTPATFRQRLLDLADELAQVRPLEVVSANRFDQQVTTKPHLDGAPPESVLLLGYEPTRVASRIALFDFAAYALSRGLSVRRFLDEYNPMSRDPLADAERFVTVVEPFDHSRYQVLLVNNADAEPNAGRQVGVMHTATIPHPDPSAERVIDSLVLAAPDPAGPPRPTAVALRAFVERGTPVLE